VHLDGCDRSVDIFEALTGGKLPSGLNVKRERNNSELSVLSTIVESTTANDR
jgi:hypothetical protein